MKKFLPIVLSMLLLSACGTRPFKPVEYPLSTDVVPAMKIHGSAMAVNRQPSTEPVIVYSYGGTALGSDLHSLTDAMVQQANHELSLHGSVVGPGLPKTIDLEVKALKSHYVAFYWHSKLTFQATLGNGVVIEKTVEHASGSVFQDLNGCIADSTGELLTDGQVQAYLTQ